MTSTSFAPPEAPDAALTAPQDWGQALAKHFSHVALFIVDGTRARLVQSHGLPSPLDRLERAPVSLLEQTPLRWTVEAASPVVGAGRAPGGASVANYLGIDTPRAYAVLPFVQEGRLTALAYVDHGNQPLPMHSLGDLFDPSEQATTQTDLVALRPEAEPEPEPEAIRPSLRPAPAPERRPEQRRRGARRAIPIADTPAVAPIPSHAEMLAKAELAAAQARAEAALVAAEAEAEQAAYAALERAAALDALKARQSAYYTDSAPGTAAGAAPFVVRGDDDFYADANTDEDAEFARDVAEFVGAQTTAAARQDDVYAGDDFADNDAWSDDVQQADSHHIRDDAALDADRGAHDDPDEDTLHLYRRDAWATSDTALRSPLAAAVSDFAGAFAETPPRSFAPLRPSSHDDPAWHETAAPRDADAADVHGVELAPTRAALARRRSEYAAQSLAAAPTPAAVPTPAAQTQELRLPLPASGPRRVRFNTPPQRAPFGAAGTAPRLAPFAQALRQQMEAPAPPSHHTASVAGTAALGIDAALPAEPGTGWESLLQTSAVQRVPRRRWGRIIVASTLAVLLLTAACAVALISPPERSGPQHVEIAANVPVSHIAADLAANQVVRFAPAFLLLARVLGVEHKLRAGSYDFAANLWPWEVISILQRGQIQSLKVTIPEGLTLREIAEVFAKNNVVERDDFIAAAQDKALAQKLGIPADTLEGFLFPETYTVAKGVSASALVEAMVREFRGRARVLPGYQGLSAAQLYDRVILASLVERETKEIREQPRVAGVFINRLEQDMRLESCASVQYILGAPKEHLTLDDIRQPSLYNTYLHPGLPPGPICNPGGAALAAALRPEESDYLFFFALEDGSHRHHFSKTFAEHQKARRTVAHK